MKLIRHPRRFLAAVFTGTLALALAGDATASSYLPPVFQALDEAGEELNGAKLYFYATGTSTPKATYSNEGLTSANAHPVEADSAGRFGSIYMLTDAAYRVRLEKSDGTLVWQKDGVRPAQLTGSSLSTRILQIASSPLDYGAACDGSTNDATDLQEAIDGATGVVDLLGKTCRSDSALVLRAGITLRNGVIDCSQAASPPSSCLSLAGSRGSTTALTSNAAAGATSVVVTSVSGFAAGDWLLIESSASWGPGSTRGELVQIDSIAVLTVNLKSPLQGTYNTADTATAREVTTKAGLVIEDVEVIASSSGGMGGGAVKVDAAEDVVLRDVLVTNVAGIGVLVQSSANVRLENVVIDGGGGTYGVLITDSSRDVRVVGGLSRQMTQGYGIGGGSLVGGVTQYVTLDGVVAEDITKGIQTPPGSNHVRISGCTVRGKSAASGYGIHIQGVNTIVDGCRVSFPGDNGIAALHASATGSGAQATAYLTLRGNEVVGATTKAFDVDPNSIVTHIDWSGNRVIGITGGTGRVLIVGDNAGGNISAYGNRVSGTDGDAVTISSTGGGRLDIVGNQIYASGASAGAALVATGSLTGGSIVGNTAITSADDSCAELAEVDGFSVAGNSFGRGGDTAPCVTISASDVVSVTGNVFNNGTYGVSLSTSTGVSGLEDNAYTGQATGNWTGTGPVGRLLGGGGSTIDVNGATTFAITGSYHVLTCDGAETINTITGGQIGTELILDHGDTDCTIADDDDATAANAIDLTGTATNDVGAVAKILRLVYVIGGYWREVSESDN